MNKEIITSEQSVSMMTLFIFGSTLVVGAGTDAKQDAWIAIILGMLMAIPAILVYSKILALFPGKDLYSIFKILFGNIFSKLMSGIYIWYSLHLGALVIRNFSEFIKIASFPETPQFYIQIFIGLICIWMIRSGLEVMGRWCSIVLPISIVLIVLIVIFGFPHMKIINIQPVLYYGIKPVVTSAFGVFSFPFAETVLFMTTLSSLKAHSKVSKVYLTSLLISGTIIVLLAIKNILLLGPDMVSNLYFPGFSSVTLINIAEFIQRVEIVSSTLFFLSGIVKISVCIYSASLGLSKIINQESYIKLCSPIGILMVNLSYILYDNSLEMVEWASNTYPYYAVPFQVILPIIILIASKIKLNHQK